MIQHMLQKHVKNKEVRAMFLDIPNIDAFINRRTAKHIGKVAKSDDSTLPKKFLRAWINRARKEGALKLTCNNSFAKMISNILPSSLALSNRSALLKEWPPVAKIEKNWQYYIDQYFDSCKKIDESDDESVEVDEDDSALSSEGVDTSHPKK
jgi:hypothetical protein